MRFGRRRARLGDKLIWGHVARECRKPRRICHQPDRNNATHIANRAFVRVRGRNREDDAVLYSSDEKKKLSKKEEEGCMTTNFYPEPRGFKSSNCHLRIDANFASK